MTKTEQVCYKMNMMIYKALLFAATLLLLGCADMVTGETAETAVPVMVVHVTATSSALPTVVPTMEPIAIIEEPVVEKTPIPTATAVVETAVSAPATESTPIIPTIIITPTATATITSTVAVRYHTVEPGETMANIASRYQISVATLTDHNNIADPSLIIAGTTLEIPFAAQVTPTPFFVGADAQKQGEIGYSTLGRPLEWYQFGSGPKQIVFVGAIHGGYEWNTALLAFQAIDYLTLNPDLIPESVTVHIIPVGNPDGLYLVTGSGGRFHRSQVNEVVSGRVNANDVDLNRNWDCNWTADARWIQGSISGGTAPFSEAETQHMRDFLLARLDQLEAVIFWHSKANLVVPGQCDGEHPPSQRLAHVYGVAAGYPVDAFTAYPVTGDVTDWLTTLDIPAVTIELRTHTETEWEQNLWGILAVLEAYS
ncbi:MAG: M14 family zinc carboxypeptidase [Chloroflexota bacterium]